VRCFLFKEGFGHHVMEALPVNAAWTALQRGRFCMRYRHEWLWRADEIPRGHGEGQEECLMKMKAHSKGLLVVPCSRRMF
jgi:hypothetical protein